ncbi:TetR family transcriptional regulator [Geomicrobium sp. JCM 19039]|uniref:TetR family transcriptional regulator n=1 Tax=Geomicrobium sp. JCM 19039 TaxID=1460636 RepID=UPI00045F1B50|nr:TetR family transcriptional regulator [Geomicrobium sp. JCM 19039]GAK10782.1 transcriptional regulator, TetR family [Geomicrobium sp. JCM 19039]
MKTNDKVETAIVALLHHSSVDQLTFAKVAREAGVHWTTVKRYFGSKETMHERVRAAEGSQHLGTKGRLLAAAKQVFKQRGYDKATLNDISSEAKLTKGAIYWYFDSKDDVFLALMDLVLTDLLRGIPEMVEQVFEQPDPEKALKAMVKHEFQRCVDDPPTLLYEFVSRRRDERVKQQLDGSFAMLFTGTEEVMRALQKRGKVSEQVDARQAAITLHALMNGTILMWAVAPESVSLFDLADTVATTMVNTMIKQ